MAWQFADAAAPAAPAARASAPYQLMQRPAEDLPIQRAGVAAVGQQRHRHTGGGHHPQVRLLPAHAAVVADDRLTSPVIDRPPDPPRPARRAEIGQRHLWLPHPRDRRLRQQTASAVAVRACEPDQVGRAHGHHGAGRCERRGSRPYPGRLRVDARLWLDMPHCRAVQDGVIRVGGGMRQPERDEHVVAQRGRVRLAPLHLDDPPQHDIANVVVRELLTWPEVLR